MASIPNNGYAEVMSGTNNYSGSNSFDGSCPQTAIAPVAANDLCNRLYVDTIAGGGSVVAVVAGNNISVTGTVPSPVVNLRNPLTAELNMGSQSLRDSASAVGTNGQLLTAGTGGQTLWQNAPSSTPTITDTNTNGTFYPVFVAGSGTQQLLADIATTTTSINPSNGNFSVVDTLKLTQDTVSIGKSAGVAQAAGGVAVGENAGNANQGNSAVAIGGFAGATSQGGAAVAIGFVAGQTNQGGSTTAVGAAAGQTTQAAGATAVGYGAGGTSQGNSAVAVGTGAGGSGQGAGAVAIGVNAGSTNQGADAIAIGGAAGLTSQTAGSICLNASGAGLSPSVAGCFINPIRGVALGIGVGRVFYNTTTFELQYSTT